MGGALLSLACLARSPRQHTPLAELHDNPCAQELHYKQRVLAACPGLEVFDRHVVKPSEVAAAKAKFGKRARGQAKRVAQTLKAPSGPLGVPMASRRRGEAAKSTARTERSKISQLLDAEARQIRKRAKAREEAAVEELFLSGSLAARSSQAVRGMDPISALTSTLSDADTGVVAAAVGASMAQRGVHAADTTALSRAGWGLVTEASQKPLTQSMRELATRPDVTYAPVAMEFKPTPAVAARLRDSRAASIAAGGATHASGAQYAAPGAQALGPWEQYHLRRLFEDSDTNGDGKLSPEELLQVLGRLGEHGVVLDGPDAGAAAATVVQLLLAQHDSDGDGRLSWKEFFGAVTGSVTHAESRDASHAAFAGASTVRLPAVRFRCLTAHEAREKSDALLAAGQRLQRRIMKSSPTSPELPELQARALKFGEQGSRLAALASKLEGKYDPAEPPAQPLPSRHDYYEASALVPVHEAVKTRARGGRSYTVKPPGEESDSDTDESDSDRVVGDDDFDAYRKVRKARKPHVVLTQATHLSASRGRSR